MKKQRAVMHSFVQRTIVLLAVAVVALYAQNSIELPKSFQANFEQTITNDNKKQIHYKGSVLYSGNNFKWSYTSPTKKDVCTDSVDLVVVDHDLEQVSYFMIDEGLDLGAIVKAATPYKKNIYIATYKLQKYTIGVDGQKQLNRIAYRDNLDNNVLIVFKNMHYTNKIIVPKKLECDIPKGYDSAGE